MKKNIFLLLLVIPVFLSACSLGNTKNISNNVPDNLQVAETDNINKDDVDKLEFQNKETANSNFVYRSDDYRFQITLPSNWSEVVVKLEDSFMSPDGKNKFQSDDIIFGFPVKVTYQEKQDVAEKCSDCFVEIFRLHVLSRNNSKKFEIAKEAYIQKEGGYPGTSEMIIAANNEYVFYGPNNFYGQSYDGEFVASRQKEAQGAVLNSFMTWNNNSDPVQNSFKVYSNEKLGITFNYPSEWPEPVLVEKQYSNGSIFDNNNQWEIKLGEPRKNYLEGADTYFASIRGFYSQSKNEIIAEINSNKGSVWFLDQFKDGYDNYLSYGEAGIVGVKNIMYFGKNGKTVKIQSINDNLDNDIYLLALSMRFLE